MIRTPDGDKHRESGRPCHRWTEPLRRDLEQALRLLDYAERRATHGPGDTP